MDNIPSRTSINPALNSGVIDMRELASRRPPAATSPSSTMDLLLSVVTPVSPLGPPLSIQIERPRTTPGLQSGGAMLAALAIVALAAGAAASLHRSPRHAPPVASAAGEIAALEPSESGLVKVASHAQLGEPVAPAPVLEPAVLPTRRPRTTPRSSTSTVTESPRASDRSAPNLEELMHRASGMPAVTPTVSSAPLSSAPVPAPGSSTPSRDEVRRAMARVTPAVQACADGVHGVAAVTVSFVGETGRVRSALVGGDFAGTSAGSCIARAVRDVELSPFSRTSFTVQYPFAL